MSANGLTASSGCSTYIIAAFAMIVVGSLGVQGSLSLHQVSTGALVTSLFNGNLPGFIVGIMGLCGATTLPIVSGVALGFSVIQFMVASCLVCVACASGGRST